MTPAIRPVHATPQQRRSARRALGMPDAPTPQRSAAALAHLAAMGFGNMGTMTHADQVLTVNDRLARLRSLHADDPEVRRLTEEVQGVR